MTHSVVFARRLEASASILTAMGDSGEGSAERSDLERLYWAASHHVRAANDKVRSADRNLRLEAAVHAGAAVELMAKAILVHVDPRLLLDDREGHHVLIDLLVERGAVTAQPHGYRSRRTVSATKAVTLAARVCEQVGPHIGAARQALDARNQAAHAAVINEARLPDQVTAGSDFVLAGVDSFARSPEAFLGADVAEQVEREVAERNAALSLAAQRKVKRAHDRYEGLVARLPEGEGDEVFTELGNRTPIHGDHTERCDCPACGNAGWLIWDVEVDFEPEGPDEYTTNAYLLFLGFECFYCGLQLNHVESEAVGINPQGDPADDFDAEPA